MDQRDPARRAGPGQKLGRKGVYAPRRLDLLFGEINLGVGRGVDDDGGLRRVERARDSVRVGDVELGPRQRREGRAAFAQRPLQVEAELAARSKDERHITPSLSPP